MSSTNQNPTAAAPAAPKESLIDRIKGLFQHVEKDAEQEFLDAWHDFEPVAKQLLQTELGQIARVAVTNTEGVLSGTEAAAAASEAIAKAAEQAGMTVATSVVNFFRELALQDLKGTLTSLPPAVAVNGAQAQS